MTISETGFRGRCSGGGEGLGVRRRCEAEAPLSGERLQRNVWNLLFITMLVCSAYYCYSIWPSSIETLFPDGTAGRSVLLLLRRDSLHPGRTSAGEAGQSLAALPAEEDVSPAGNGNQTTNVFPETEPGSSSDIDEANSTLRNTTLAKQMTNPRAGAANKGRQGTLEDGEDVAMAGEDKSASAGRLIGLLPVPMIDLDGPRCLELTLQAHRSHVEEKARLADQLTRTSVSSISSKNATTASPDVLRPIEENQKGGADPHDDIFRRRSPRTLFYSDWQYIDTVMDRHLFHTYCGAFASTAFSEGIMMWGRGWPGWNDSLPAAENILWRTQGNPFDVIITKENPQALNITGVTYLTYRHECVYHEMHVDLDFRWRCSWYEEHHPWKHYDILILTYENDLLALYDKFGDRKTGRFRDSEDVLISHWPHSVLPGTYIQKLQDEDDQRLEGERNGTFTSYLDNRPYDICLIGSTFEKLYPLRFTVSRWIEDGTFASYGLNAKQLRHFGYTELLSAQDRKSKGINATALEAQYRNYVNFLFQCKATIATRSKRDYDLRKYLEIAMAGSLLVGNVPSNSHAYNWSGLVLDIEEEVANNKTKEAMEKIQLWLSPAHEKVTLQRIEEARLVAFSRGTAQRAWDLTEEAILTYKFGRRGFMVSPRVEMNRRE